MVILEKKLGKLKLGVAYALGVATIHRRPHNCSLCMCVCVICVYCYCLCTRDFYVSVCVFLLIKFQIFFKAFGIC